MPSSARASPARRSGRALELRAGVKTFRYLAPLGDDAPGVLVSIAFPIDILRADTRNLTLVSVALLGGVMIAVGLLVFFTVRRATERLAKLTRTVAGLAEKDDLTLEIEVSGNDEVAAVAAAFAKLIERMRLMLGALNQASLTLSQAGANLNESSQHQQTIVARQAAAIQESLVTAEEIKRTSVTAAERAEGVLRVAEQALKAGEEGELSIQQSLSGLADIRAHVGEIAERINQLSTRTQQISGITGTVKDLADSSNMLALNAAIEAVRSGEHGKGFGVVAREIRSLADQSIQATKQVREILEDIRGAIQTAVAISEQGSARIESGLVQMRASGETLRSLAGTVKENSSAARQIAAAVSQQNAGIVQIFSALTDQSRLTEESLKQLEETSAVAGEMEEITNQVTALVRQYRV